MAHHIGESPDRPAAETDEIEVTPEMILRRACESTVLAITMSVSILHMKLLAVFLRAAIETARDGLDSRN
jgi:hypothetical protein